MNLYIDPHMSCVTTYPNYQLHHPYPFLSFTDNFALSPIYLSNLTMRTDPTPDRGGCWYSEW